MVRGLDRFRVFFRDFQDQYILIGGAACDILLSKSNFEFRVTRDLDIVLIAEALTTEFGRRFWEFIQEGGYANLDKSDGTPQYFRFTEPSSDDYPQKLELLTRTDTTLNNETQRYKSLGFGYGLASLSAILLNDEYCQLLSDGRIVVDEIPMLSYSYLVLFKAKAWLNLNAESDGGKHVNSNDIKKHLNDIARLSVLFTGTDSVTIPTPVYNDLHKFINAFESKPPNMEDLEIPAITGADVVETLRSVYSIMDK